MTKIKSTSLVTTGEILQRASELFLVSVENITSKKRDRRRIVPARQAVCLALRRRGLSFARIGQILGYTDHTTPRHSCVKAEEREARDERYRTRIEALTRYGTVETEVKPPRTCRSCDVRLDYRNVSGLCRNCYTSSAATALKGMEQTQCT